MVIDLANLTNTNVQTTPDREVTPDVVKESNVNNEGLSGAGRTSEIGPAVVNNVSVSTLETSRAATAPEQTAEQNRNDDIITAQQKGQLNEKNLSPGQAPRQSQIDKNI
jgi:hypothetical protein